jgi:hypothetical protein
LILFRTKIVKIKYLSLSRIGRILVKNKLKEKYSIKFKKINKISVLIIDEINTISKIC